MNEKLKWTPTVAFHSPAISLCRWFIMAADRRAAFDLDQASKSGQEEMFPNKDPSKKQKYL